MTPERPVEWTAYLAEDVREALEDWTAICEARYGEEVVAELCRNSANESCRLYDEADAAWRRLAEFLP